MHDFLINETSNQLILFAGSSFWLLTSNAHNFRCHLALALAPGGNVAHKVLHQAIASRRSFWLIARNAQAFR
jgi:hypothetical protein